MENNSIEFIKIFDAPIEKVWDAWTNESFIKQWLAPEGKIASYASISLYEGGRYKITMKDASYHEVTVTGIYVVIQKPAKLVFTWKWTHQNDETQVTILFKKLDPEKTEITIKHEGFSTRENKDMHEAGWKGICINLHKILIKGGEK